MSSSGRPVPAEPDGVSSSAGGSRLDALLAALNSGIANGLRDSDHRLVEKMLHGNVTAYLVIEERVHWPSVASTRFGEPGRLRGRARHAAHAVHIIEADPAGISSINDLARLANVTARTLQLAFRECVGVSPMEYLRRVRLERVHWDLLAADPMRVAVGEIARRHGFSHVGRFAAAYRQVYGCNPSSTLRTSLDDPRRAVRGKVTSGADGIRRVVIPVGYPLHAQLQHAGRRDEGVMRDPFGDE